MYNHGDKVIVVSQELANSPYITYPSFFSEEMYKFCNKIVTIDFYEGEDRFNIIEDGNYWHWDANMFVKKVV